MTRKHEALDAGGCFSRSVRVRGEEARVLFDRLDDGVRFRSARPWGLHDSPMPWLSSEHNERLAQQLAVDRSRGGSSNETEAVVEARAGWKMLEVFVALLPIGWG